MCATQADHTVSFLVHVQLSSSYRIVLYYCLWLAGCRLYM